MRGENDDERFNHEIRTLRRQLTEARNPFAQWCSMTADASLSGVPVFAQTSNGGAWLDVFYSEFAAFGLDVRAFQWNSLWQHSQDRPRHPPTPSVLHVYYPIVGGNDRRDIVTARTEAVIANLRDFCEHGGSLVFTCFDELPSGSINPDCDRRLRQEMFDLASVVHLPNAPLLDLCRQMYDIDDRKVYLAPLPLYDGVHPTGTPSRLGARRRFGFGDDDRVVLQFGALREQKGVDRVLDAVARAQQVDPSMRLLLAGPVVDAEHEYGRAMIDAANELPGSVVVEGFVPDRFVGTVLRAADLNVCGYRWSRSSGVLVLSLGFDVPVLGPDEPDFMALAERTDMVTTFDNRDANALTEHLVAWASTPRRSTVLDQQLREELDPIRFSRRFAEAITTRVNADTKMSGSSGVRSAST